MRAATSTILVVDDDAEIRATLRAVLEEEGYGVVTAENGAQALAEIQRRAPDLMLLDLMMPVCSGWEVLETLEETGRLSDFPIVIVSAMCAPGARECLCKPVDLDDLLGAVARHCRRPQESQGAPAH